MAGMWQSSSGAPRDQVSLPSDMRSRLRRYGRHKVDRHTSGEPGPLDPGWDPIIPIAFEMEARTDPPRYVHALSELAVPVGGWTVYGAAEFALDIGTHDLEDPAYRRLFADGLMVRRAAGVPWPMLNGFDQEYWSAEHPDEPWQPPRIPPAREEAVLSPLAVGEERAIARVSGDDDSKVLYATRPSAETYAIVIAHPQDEGPPTRGVMFEADGQYDAYLGVGMHEFSLAHFWTDAEFEPFCRYLWPRFD